MIDFLPMRRTTEVLIQGVQGAKALLTEITTIARPVPGSAGGQLRGIGLLTVPLNLLVGEYMTGIHFAAVLIDFLAIDARCAGP